MTTIISFIFLLGVLIFVHELGHFLAARSVGMRVEKFYLGFNLFGLGLHKKWGDTEYGIGLFPLGGYVKVSGILDESFDDSATGAPYEYQSKKSWQQIWFASAGVIMNFLLAIIIFTIITLKMGIGEVDNSPVIGQVLPDYPAYDTGLVEDDEIISVNGVNINNWDEMTSIIQPIIEEQVIIEWLHDGIILKDSVITKVSENIVSGKVVKVGMIGISKKINLREATIIESVQEGFRRTNFWFMVIVDSIKMLITGEASLKDVGGPIMIAQLTGESVKSGLLSFFNLMAIISINLAFLNILPIPALDGGHIIISLTEGIIRRKLPVKIKLGFQQIGVVLMLLLFVVVMFNDISRLFN